MSHSEHLAVLAITRLKALDVAEQVSEPAPGDSEFKETRVSLPPGVEGTGVLRCACMVVFGVSGGCGGCALSVRSAGVLCRGLEDGVDARSMVKWPC
jgi:hypothetical protein